MQVRSRQRQVLGEGAIAIADAEHVTLLAMGWAIGETGWAIATGHVDLAGYPRALELRRAWRAQHLADELVAGYPGERSVAAQ